MIRLISNDPGEPSSTKATLARPNPIELSVAAFPIALGPGERIIALGPGERKATRQWDTTIAILAHELHDPLTVIKAYSQLMLRETPLTTTQREWLENIQVSSERIAAFGSGLVSAAHIRLDDVTVNFERMAVCEVIDSVVTTFTLSATNHSFELEMPSHLPEVIGNRFKLEQVIRNLLDNAVKYSPAGKGVTIAAHHQPEQQRVVIRVIDQGIGLGLFIVKQLVELMGGNVWVDSELDQGSTFFVSLPTAP